MDSKNQDVHWHQRFRNYQKALIQLNKAVSLFEQRGLSNLEKEGWIQRFEFTHELAWNVMQDFLKDKGDDKIYGSKDATRLAFNKDIIENGQIWMDMIKDRNLSSHVYKEEIMEKVTSHILNSYAAEFNKFDTTMEKLILK